MATLNLPNVRIASDVRFKVKLTDNSVAVDWTSLTGIRAFAYSDAQRIMAGELQASIDPTDSEVLIVNYEDTVPQYQGIVRLVIRGDYDGRQKTFDKPVINFVEFTAQATGVTVITDPVVDVTLAVTEVSTSLLDEAIDACIAATALAEEAATHGPKIDPNNKHWLVWDAEEGEYVDTGIVAEGGAGTTNFNNLTNRPKYNGSQMTGETNIPTVPTKTSDLTNDSGFLTEHQSLAAYRTSAAQDVIDATKASASDVDAIEAKIPAQATAQNQLADKNFVNSSIQTATADFKGSYDITDNGWTKIIRRSSFNEYNYETSHPCNMEVGSISWNNFVEGMSVTIVNTYGTTILTHDFYFEEFTDSEYAFSYHSEALEQTMYGKIHLKIYEEEGEYYQFYEVYIKGNSFRTWSDNYAVVSYAEVIYMDALGLTPANNNDYMYLVTDQGGTLITQRWKFSSEENDWVFEYNLNTTGFTAAQLAALNSGITESLVTAFGAKYNKPASGIPESDLANAVKAGLVKVATYGTTTYAQIESWYNAGNTVKCKYGLYERTLVSIQYNIAYFVGLYRGNAYVVYVNNNDLWREEVWGYELTANRETTTASFETNKANTSKYPSNFVVNSLFGRKVSQIAVANSVASQELAPNTLYVFATRSSDLALTFGAAISGIANEYNFILTIDSTTLPTISGLSGITWNGGSAPAFALGKKYEVSIQEGVGVFIEI